MVAESHLQNVAVSSLSLKTTGILRFLVRDSRSKIKNSSQVFTQATTRRTTVEQLFRVETCILCAGFTKLFRELYGRPFSFTCQEYLASAIFAQGTPLLYDACSFNHCTVGSMNVEEKIDG